MHTFVWDNDGYYVLWFFKTETSCLSIQQSPCFNQTIQSNRHSYVSGIYTDVHLLLCVYSTFVGGGVHVCVWFSWITYRLLNMHITYGRKCSQNARIKVEPWNFSSLHCQVLFMCSSLRWYQSCSWKVLCQRRGWGSFVMHTSKFVQVFWVGLLNFCSNHVTLISSH